MASAGKNSASIDGQSTCPVKVSWTERTTLAEGGVAIRWTTIPTSTTAATTATVARPRFQERSGSSRTDARTVSLCARGDAVVPRLQRLGAGGLCCRGTIVVRTREGDRRHQTVAALGDGLDEAWILDVVTEDASQFRDGSASTRRRRRRCRARPSASGVLWATT